MKITKLLIVFMLIPFLSLCNTDKENALFVEEYFQLKRATLPVYDKEILDAATHLMNLPYAAATLEGNETEQLVVNLEAFDCTTFVETVMAMTLAEREENPTYEGFKEALQQIRYRDGIIDGYASRLHYISDWIQNNRKMGLIEDRTCAIGGIPFSPSINYMSTHPELYPALREDKQEVERMKAIEEEVNQDSTLCFIPKEKINQLASKIKDGDILFFTTSIKGLDVQHAGIAFHDGDRLTFIHASSRAKKVIIQPGTLDDYCRKSKTITGILIIES